MRARCARDGVKMSGLFTKDIAVLDISSRLISAIVGMKKTQCVFGIKAVSEQEYSGFEEGQWYDEEETRRVASSVLKDAMYKAESSTKRVFIGVPAEFVAVQTEEVEIALDRERKVIDADIDYLIEKGKKNLNLEGLEIINSSAISYTIDGADKLYSDVRGLTASKVGGIITYILCVKPFIELFNGVCSTLGFKEIKYISTAWAEGITLFESEERDNMYAIADIGAISSSVMIGMGEGIVDMESFSCGGQYISADMCEELDVEFSQAEKARELVDLNLSYSEDAMLVADGENIIYGAEAKEFTMERLDYFAQIIEEFLTDFDFPSYAPVYITGEGIAAIRGVKKYMSAQLGRTVDIKAPKLPGYAKPCHSSKISLLMVAESLTKFNLFDKIKKVLNGGKL